MGKIFTIDDSIKSIAQDAIDDLIDQLGKNCKLMYPPKMIVCPNCVSNPVGNKSSVWRTGGPVPFPLGSICPMCGGTGRIAEEKSDIIKLLINEDPKTFSNIGKNISIQIPDGTIQTKGYLTDLPKVMNCDYLIKHIEIAGYIEYKYKLYGEPISPGNIVQGRYFSALWQRTP